MKLLFTYQDAAHAAEIEYAAEVLLGGFDLQLVCAHEPQASASAQCDLHISYGTAPPPARSAPQICISASDFFTRTPAADDLRTMGAGEEHAGVTVPFGGSGACFERDELTIRTRLDLIAATFFLAARAEEHLISARDKHGRFRAVDSHAGRNGYLDRPVIDEWAALLQKWFRILGRSIERRPPAGGGRFFIGLTHDIDRVAGGWSEAIFHSLKQWRRPGRALRSTAKILGDRLRGNDPYWTFERLLAIEEELGVRSSFYFLPHTGERLDAQYDWETARFRALFAMLRRGNWEIGIHGSYDSIRRARLTAECAALQRVAEAPIIGGRQHFLRFDVRTAWDAYQDAGLRYDSSLGYAEALGFRAGLCRPYRPFCVAGRQAYNLLEVPLVAMDTTLRTYLQVPVDEVWERLLPILQRVRDHRGAVAILWHNTHFAGHKFAGYDEIYQRMIRWVQQHDGCCGPLAALVAPR